MQQRIINRVEGDIHYRSMLAEGAPKPENTPADAIIAAARQIADTIRAKAIVCFSLRGSTVLRAAKGRPGVPILAISPFKETARQLVLSWGVYPGNNLHRPLLPKLVYHDLIDWCAVYRTPKDRNLFF
jgi:pyruvate kinase